METFHGHGLLLVTRSMLQTSSHITQRQEVVAVSVWVGTACFLYNYCSSSGERGQGQGQGHRRAIRRREIQLGGVLFGRAFE